MARGGLKEGGSRRETLAVPPGLSRVYAPLSCQCVQQLQQPQQLQQLQGVSGDFLAELWTGFVSRLRRQFGSERSGASGGLSPAGMGDVVSSHLDEAKRDMVTGERLFLPCWRPVAPAPSSRSWQMLLGAETAPLINVFRLISPTFSLVSD